MNNLKKIALRAQEIRYEKHEADSFDNRPVIKGILLMARILSITGRLSKESVTHVMDSFDNRPVIERMRGFKAFSALRAPKEAWRINKHGPLFGGDRMK